MDHCISVTLSFQPAGSARYAQFETATKVDLRAFPGLPEHFQSYMRHQQDQLKEKHNSEHYATCFHSREIESIIESCWPRTFLVVQGDYETKQVAIPACYGCVYEALESKGGLHKHDTLVPGGGFEKGATLKSSEPSGSKEVH